MNSTGWQVYGSLCRRHNTVVYQVGTPMSALGSSDVAFEWNGLHVQSLALMKARLKILSVVWITRSNKVKV